MIRAITEATKDANAPAEALVATAEVEEVDARAAVDACFSVSGGTATATRLGAWEAVPMAASPPTEKVVAMCPDELKNFFGLLWQWGPMIPTGELWREFVTRTRHGRHCYGLS